MKRHMILWLALVLTLSILSTWRVEAHRTGQAGTDGLNRILLPRKIHKASSANITWTIECVDCPRTFGGPSNRGLVIDNAGHPHIVYGGDHLYYATYDGSTWSIQTVDSAPGVGGSASLALDSNGYPHITYYDGVNYDLKYAAWNGTAWSVQTVDSAGNVGYTSSLALDSLGNPHIVYSDATNRTLKYAVWTMGWSIQVIDSSGYPGSLTLDANDTPHVSYLDIVNRDLKYATWTGNTWNIQTIDSTGDVGIVSSIAVIPMSI